LGEALQEQGMFLVAHSDGNPRLLASAIARPQVDVLRWPTPHPNGDMAVVAGIQMPFLIVRLHGGLAELTGSPATVQLDLPATLTLLDIQDYLGIPRGEIGLFLLDRQMGQEGTVVGEARQLDIYPIFGGG
jgi:hypothetical protein